MQNLFTRISPEGLGLLLLLPLPPVFTELIRDYVWHEPRHIISLVICYYIALITDMIIMYRSRRLTAVLGIRAVGRSMGNTIGALALMMLSTGLCTITDWLFWMPDLSVSIIGIAIFMQCVRNFSKLKVLDRRYHKMLEDKVESNLNIRIDEEMAKEPPREQPKEEEPVNH